MSWEYCRTGCGGHRSSTVRTPEGVVVYQCSVCGDPTYTDTGDDLRPASTLLTSTTKRRALTPAELRALHAPITKPLAVSYALPTVMQMVGARELAAARRWLDDHVADVRRELGLPYGTLVPFVGGPYGFTAHRMTEPVSDYIVFEEPVTTEVIDVREKAYDMEFTTRRIIYTRKVLVNGDRRVNVWVGGEYRLPDVVSWLRSEGLL